MNDYIIFEIINTINVFFTTFSSKYSNWEVRLHMFNRYVYHLSFHLSFASLFLHFYCPILSLSPLSFSPVHISHPFSYFHLHFCPFSPPLLYISEFLPSVHLFSFLPPQCLILSRRGGAGSCSLPAGCETQTSTLCCHGEPWPPAPIIQ